MSIDHGKVLALLKIAVCPNKENGCDGEQYPVGDPAGDFHGEQCQWCAERREAMAAEIDRLAEAADGESIESPQSHAYYNAVRALAQPAEAVDARCFRGPGHLERTGYIPEGSAAEREASHDAAQGAVAFRHRPRGSSGQWSYVDHRSPDSFELRECEIESLSLTHPQAAPAQGDGVGLIAAERRRQVEAEGWTPEHDDEHAGSELAEAAACYALGRRLAVWPWGIDWWKPSPDNRVRDLVKAGALIAAEIDRLQRAAAPSQEPRERKWYDEGEPVDESKVSNQAQEPRS